LLLRLFGPELELREMTEIEKGPLPKSKLRYFESGCNFGMTKSSPQVSGLLLLALCR
jgi:hypothetical protein